MDFLTPNLEVLAQPLEVAHPSGASPLYPLLLKSTACQEDVFPLSPTYLRLLGRLGIGDAASSSLMMSGIVPNLAWTSRHWPQVWAVAILIAGLLPHLSLYPPVRLHYRFIFLLYRSVHP